MSDTTYTSVSVKTRLIDIIDTEWTEDCLSDDDIEIPKEFEFSIEEEEDEDEATPKDDEWNDLGLDQFLADMAQSVAPPIPLSSPTENPTISQT
jgi:hypothetical protein